MRSALHAAVGRKPRFSAAPLCLLLAMPAGAFAQSGSNAPTQMSPLVVTASGFAQDVKEAPASISVITREELEQKRFSSLAEALTEIEGVDVEASVGKTGGMNISIRGMPSEYTLILIDGRRQNNAGDITPNGFSETQTSFIPPVSAIERIEVVRGPMSTLYGSDAMGGVINIITRKVAPEWGGSVTLDGTLQQHSEFGNTSGASVYASGPLVENLLGLQVRGRAFKRSASDITYEETGGTEVTPWMGANPVDADIYNGGARLTYTPSKEHDFWADVDITRQTYDNSTGQLGTLGAGGYAPEQKYNRDQFAIGHNGRFSFGELTTSLMRNSTETVGRLIPPGTPGKVAGSPRTLEAKNTVLDTKLVVPFSAHVTTVGGQWWDAEMIEGVASERFEQTQWALFAEDEWFLADRLALTTGVRYDNHDSFGDQLSPRAYLVWNPTDSWTFKGGVARGFKTPRLEQLHDGIYGFGQQGHLPFLGNPDLKPETSTSTELSAQYSARSGFRAGITVFNNEFQDKISSIRIPNCRVNNVPGCVDIGVWPTRNDPSEEQPDFPMPINVDEAVTRGIELSTFVPLSQTLSLTANYTYTDSEQKSGVNKGMPLTDTPEHMVNARLRWQATDRLNAWLSGEYNSERFRDNETVRAVLGDYKAYTLFHAGLGYDITKNLTIAATIYNLTDKDFVDYRPTGSGYFNVYHNNFEGRRLWLSATYQF